MSRQILDREIARQWGDAGRGNGLDIGWIANDVHANLMRIGERDWQAITEAILNDADVRRAAERAVKGAMKPAPGEEGGRGEQSEGVEVRLRAAKLQWKANEDPRLAVDLRSRGARPVTFLATLQDPIEFEVNGTWFAGKTSALMVANSNVIVPRVLRPAQTVSLADLRPWSLLCKNVQTGEPLGKLAPGKHAIRSALAAHHLEERVGEAAASLPKADPSPLRVMSNAVEIEILPEKD